MNIFYGGSEFWSDLFLQEAFIFSWDERKAPTKNNNVAKDNLVLGIPEYAGLAEIFQTSPGASS